MSMNLYPQNNFIIAILMFISTCSQNLIDTIKGTSVQDNIEKEEMVIEEEIDRAIEALNDSLNMIVKSKPPPTASETTEFWIHVSIEPLELSNDTVTRTPSPAGMVAPVNEKAKSVVAEALIVKPASAEEPPLPPVISKPANPN